MRQKKSALFTSVISLLLVVSMLVGSTYAWFTDTVVSANNVIISGDLDIELEYLDGDTWKAVEETTNVFAEDSLWEPGYTEVIYLRVRNAGNLALKYGFGVNVVSETGSVNKLGQPFKLSDYVRFGMILSDSETIYADRAAARAALTDTQALNAEFTRDLGALYPAGNPQGLASTQYVTMVVYMPEEVGNEANHALDAAMPMLKLGLSVAATQKTYEEDSFGSDYDAAAPLPTFDFPENSVHDSATVRVTPDSDGKLTAPVTLQGFQTVANVPAGVKLATGASELTMTVRDKTQSDANITLEDSHSQRALDVHIEGVAADNTAPIAVTLTDVAPVGMNLGNLNLYHVENGTTVPMTQVAADADFTAHNQYKYDPATGELTLYMATFSEVAMVADTENAWNGNRDYTWYDESKSQLTIANADQLAGFGTIVGGMEGKTQDSFNGKTVKLICDINIGDTQDGNGLTFYPIGYNNDVGGYERIPEVDVVSGFYAFCGTFDGNGQTIANFYQNTWEMFGDYNDGYAGKPNYFRDGMGLFGKVYGGTVKNLTVQNFQSDGEHTTTGVIAAYADSLPGQPALFENISILNCNPRVYNIGNGGIVGCAGWYSRNESLGAENYGNAVTFRNITVDQSNKISALWGSWGVSCGGILGQYYPNSGCGIKLENCHVAAVIDVNNDVCSNYQYYWYRYAGMFIGTIRANTKDVNGYTVADTTGVSAKDCTYTMGDWNEYWYCELVKNSLASYTHDHQFSRLDKISSVSEIQDAEGNWSKEGNFVIPNGDNTDAECYHIFKDADGKLYQHFHEDSGYETTDVDGDGVVDSDLLKEDRQRYFIPFNQLLTGLDMGIKAHTEFDGITFVENGTTKSVQKFNVTEKNLIPENGTVTVGSLFTASGEGTIAPATVQVYVSPVGDNSTVSATYSGNVADWEQGTLTFSGRGAANVVINDYYYCTSTTLPIYVLGGEYYIATQRNPGDYWYMTNDLGTASTKRYQATNAGTTLPDVITNKDDTKTFCLIPNDNGTFKIQNGEEYLVWDSGNSGNFGTEAEAENVTVTYDPTDKTYNIFISDPETRILSLNNNPSNDYFAWYGSNSNQRTALKLIPVQPGEQGDTPTEPTGTKTYTFNEYAAGTQYAVNEKHVLDDMVTVTTTESHFTTELRIYSSSAHNGHAIIQAADGNAITAFGFRAGNEADTLNVYGSNDGINWTLIEGVEVDSSYADHTVNMTTPYQYLKLDVAGDQQIRLQSMTLTFGTACQHSYTSQTTEPTCSESGYTTYTCSKCGHSYKEETGAPTGEHKYVDGYCTVCGAAVPTYTATFEVPSGVSAVSSITANGQITLPTAGAPASYTFEGWVTDASATTNTGVVSGTYTLTEDVTFYALYSHEESTNGTYELVTNVSQLTAGKKVIIAAKDNDVAMSTTQNTNNRATATVTKSGNILTCRTDTAVLELRAGTVADTFAFYDPANSGYLYAASSSNNHLRTEKTLSTNSSWKITITSAGVATIKAQGNYTRNVMQYNPNNGGSPLFACYSSASLEAVCLYVMNGGTTTIVYTTLLG